MQPKLKLVVNNSEPEKGMTQEQYERRLAVVWSFAVGTMFGLVMAAWMALGR